MPGADQFANESNISIRSNESNISERTKRSTISFIFIISLIYGLGAGKRDQIDNFFKSNFFI